MRRSARPDAPGSGHLEAATETRYCCPEPSRHSVMRSATSISPPRLHYPGRLSEKQLELFVSPRTQVLLHLIAIVGLVSTATAWILLLYHVGKYTLHIGIVASCYLREKTKNEHYTTCTYSTRTLAQQFADYFEVQDFHDKKAGAKYPIRSKTQQVHSLLWCQGVARFGGSQQWAAVQ